MGKSYFREVVMDRERIMGKLALYYDLKADVRYSNSHVPIRQLVTPDNPEVIEVARILHEDPDFIIACQDFVHDFTTYVHEEGDYWATAGETLNNRKGDCDCLSILLCSLLRVYIPAEKVYCCVCEWTVEGVKCGHMYVIIDDDGEDLILEATAASDVPLIGSYNIYMIFNDKYVCASEQGLKLFDLKPISPQNNTLVR
jgi:hypothetical protein